MACPHFHGVKPHSRTGGSPSAMLPLGDAWEGVCRAVPGETWVPDETTLLGPCNMGYARGACARFPAGEGPDAARFTLVRDEGARLRLYYVLERDHHPWAHGPLEYSVIDGAFLNSDAGGIASRLAHHYVESYLRRKAEASGHGTASG
jgi:hypothetical protein